MHFNEAKTRLTLATPGEIEFINEITLATRYADEGKERPLHPDKPLAQAPFEFGDGSTKGILHILERAAVDVKDKLGLSFEVRHEAYVVLLALNEQLGKRGDPELKARLDKLMNEQ